MEPMEPLKVRELIAELQKLNQELEVFVWSDGDYWEVRDAWARIDGDGDFVEIIFK